MSTTTTSTATTTPSNKKPTFGKAIAGIDQALTDGIITLRYFNFGAEADEFEDTLQECRAFLVAAEEKLPDGSALDACAQRLDSTCGMMMHLWITKGWMAGPVVFQDQFEKWLARESSGMSKLIDATDKHKAWLSITSGEASRRNNDDDANK